MNRDKIPDCPHLTFIFTAGEDTDSPNSFHREEFRVCLFLSLRNYSFFDVSRC